MGNHREVSSLPPGRRVQCLHRQQPPGPFPNCPPGCPWAKMGCPTRPVSLHGEVSAREVQPCWCPFPNAPWFPPRSFLFTHATRSRSGAGAGLWASVHCHSAACHQPACRHPSQGTRGLPTSLTQSVFSQTPWMPAERRHHWSSPRIVACQTKATKQTTTRPTPTTSSSLLERWGAVSPPAGPTAWHCGTARPSKYSEAWCPGIAPRQHGPPRTGPHHWTPAGPSLLARHVRRGAELHPRLSEVCHGAEARNQHHLWSPHRLTSIGGPRHRLYEVRPGQRRQRKRPCHDGRFHQVHAGRTHQEPRSRHRRQSPGPWMVSAVRCSGTDPQRPGTRLRVPSGERAVRHLRHQEDQNDAVPPAGKRPVRAFRCEQVLFVRFYNNPTPLNGSMQFHYCTLVTREPEQTTLLFWSAACGWRNATWPSHSRPAIAASARRLFQICFSPLTFWPLVCLPTLCLLSPFYAPSHE